MIHNFCFKCITIQGFNTLLFKKAKYKKFWNKVKKRYFYTLKKELCKPNL